MPHPQPDPAVERLELLHQLRLWNRQIIANGGEPPLHQAAARIMPLGQLRRAVEQTGDFLLDTFAPDQRD